MLTTPLQFATRFHHRVVRGGKFRESALAHRYFDGQHGLEIGGSAHNPFGLRTQNVDYTADMETKFKRKERETCGSALKVDIVYDGLNLPFADGTQDFVISSHVIEHFYDPIAAIEEWLRVTRPGGHVFMIVPHRDRTFDRDRPRTTIAELVQRHEYPDPPEDLNRHHSVWITEDFVDLCFARKWRLVEAHDVDDKVGNGFTIVIRKP